MNISIFYDHVVQAAEQSKKSIEEILTAAYSEGITAVDINNSSLCDPEFMPLLRRVGMRLNASAEFYNWGGDEYQNETRLKAQIDNAAKNGAKLVLVIPGFIEDSEAHALNALLDEIGIPESGNTIDPRLDAFMKGNESIMKMTEMLRRAVSYGKEKKIAVTIEDFDNFRAPYARTLGVLWFMKNVDGLRFTFDTGNFIYSDERMEDGFELLKDYIVHVHTKDRGAEASCTGFKFKKGMVSVATGGGYLPIATYAKKLLERGYTGYFAIEHYGHPNQEAAILASAKHLKQI